jgi:O-antigen ligase
MDKKFGKIMFKKFKDISKDETRAQILYWLCTGFVYSMLFWTYLNSILAIVISTYWLFFLKKEFNLSSQRSKMVILFISLYLVGMIGLIYTSNMTKGAAIMQKQSALLFFPLVFGTTSVFSFSLLKKIINHYLIATGLACIIGLCIGLYNFSSTGEMNAITGKGLLYFHAFNPIVMGLYCLLALIFIFTYDLGERKKRKPGLIILSVILSVFIFMLSIRIIIFSWFLLVLYFIWKKIEVKSYRIIFSLGLLLLVVISGLTITPLKKKWVELVNFSEKNSIVLDKDSSLGHPWGGKAIRIAIWKCSADIIRDHWLLGVGTGDTQDSLQQEYENRKFYFASRYNQYNAHNQYLQFAIGLGIPGFLLFVLNIIIPFFQYSRKYLPNIYLIFLAVFAITALTESLLEINKGIILYSFFNSIFAFTTITDDKQQ